MEIAEKNFNLLYKKLVKHVLNAGDIIKVQGKRTIECTSCLIKLGNVDNDHVDFDKTESHKRQDQYEHYRRREIEWYESGCLLAKHAPANFWKKISNKDGKIQSNYGYLILHEKRPYAKKNLTSYKNILNIFKKDKFSRQAVLHYNLPSHYANNKKDIPCTVCTQVIIRKGKLNFLVFQRSADLYFGLPHDIHWHCYLMKRLVADLNGLGIKVSCGEVAIFIGSVHIYKKDVSFMKKFLIKRKKSHVKEK